MKKHSIYILLAAMLLTSCHDWLDEKVYTQPTGEYIVSTPAGMASAVLAMYYKDREIFRNNDDAETILWMNMLVGDDITYCRAGEGIPQFGRYQDLLPTTPSVARLWKQQYALIGYANMVIGAADKVDMTDPVAIQAVAEARVFRAHAYLRLLQRYDNIYLTTRVTTPENVNDSISYTPAAKEDVYALMDEDLDYAIDHLAWTTTQPGRFTQGVARLLRAKSAAWQSKWQECANQINAIEQSGVYALLSDPREVFDAANLNHSEAILVSQWNKATGGWFTNTVTNSNSGHRMCIICTPKYNEQKGMLIDYASGGYPWGRVFPNQYLLSLYDRAHDLRYTAWYKTAWTYNDPDNLPRGRHVGDTLVATTEAAYQNVHPMCTKYNDSYTKASPTDNESFKDIIIYRLPEAYILGCEAYIHLGRQDSAAYYYNKTYTRAGNAAETQPITIEMLADEQARELALEGDRWNFLKRENLLVKQVQAHGGEYVYSERWGVLNNDTIIRNNVSDYHNRWPIPQAQRDIMHTFPQNPGY